VLCALPKKPADPVKGLAARAHIKVYKLKQKEGEVPCTLAATSTLCLVFLCALE
jgi:hypothetical protein